MTKVYYKIGEVSKITGLPNSTLRHWETEFKQLNPKKSAGGQRFYTEKHIELIERIKTMLYVEKMQIDGAKKKLEISGKDCSTGMLAAEEIKSELNELLKILERPL